MPTSIIVFAYISFVFLQLSEGVHVAKAGNVSERERTRIMYRNLNACINLLGDAKLYVELIFRIAGPCGLQFGARKLWNLPLRLPKFHCNYILEPFTSAALNMRSIFARFV